MTEDGTRRFAFVATTGRLVRFAAKKEPAITRKMRRSFAFVAASRSWLQPLSRTIVDPRAKAREFAFVSTTGKLTSVNYRPRVFLFRAFGGTRLVGLNGDGTRKRSEKQIAAAYMPKKRKKADAADAAAAATAPVASAVAKRRGGGGALAFSSDEDDDDRDSASDDASVLSATAFM